MQIQARLEDWLSLRPALVHVYEGPVAALGRNASVPPGGNHYAWFLTKGTVTVRQEGKVVRAEPGQWLLAYPGARRQDFSRGARIISIHFQIKWPDGHNLFEEGLSAVLDGSLHPALEQEARALLAAMRGILPGDWLQILKTRLTVEHYFVMQHQGLGFLVALSRALEKERLIPSRIGQTDDRLLGALRQLNHHPLHLPLDERRLARKSGLSHDHLSLRFRDAFGLTPNGYIENRRRDYARRLLAHSGVPAKEIASNLGFHALSGFSVWFKRSHGLSPREFRRSALSSRYL